MYGMSSLKGSIVLTDSAVECPVRQCNVTVPRQQGTFRSDDRYRCSHHKIAISPSTFEYETDADNLLWHSAADLALLGKIRVSKRESRMRRDNSEDAVSWNVFRCLELNNLLGPFLKTATGITVASPELVYWSYSSREDRSMRLLEAARQEFELVPSRGSEPDLIVDAREALVFIEAKVGSKNVTTAKEKVRDKYVTAGNGWWSKVFRSTFNEVAVCARLYELARFWLLGTWMADQEPRRPFYLLDMVCRKRERDLEQRFGAHIFQGQTRIFKRIEWEGIAEFASATRFESEARNRLLSYFADKSLGYGPDHKLRKAFDCSS